MNEIKSYPTKTKLDKSTTGKMPNKNISLTIKSSDTVEILQKNKKPIKMFQVQCEHSKYQEALWKEQLVLIEKEIQFRIFIASRIQKALQDLNSTENLNNDANEGEEVHRVMQDLLNNRLIENLTSYLVKIDVYVQ